MSQHDYVINNSDGLTVRNDINSVLGAIQSTNSGATAPTATTAYMFWADTNLELQNQRNAADTAWITQAVLTHAGISTNGSLVTDGLFHIVSGSAGVITANVNADELVVEGSGNTGISILSGLTNLGIIYFGRSTDNSVAGIRFDHNTQTMFLFADDAGADRISINGLETVMNTGGFDDNFRVRSGLNTHMFFVDAGNNSVHIDNNLLTGAGDGDLVLANENFIKWINNAGTSSANFGIKATASDNLSLDVPLTTNSHLFRFAGINRGQITEQNIGLGIVFLGESSADHSSPGANNLVLFTKDDGGVTKLFYRNTTGVSEIAVV